MFRQQFRPLLGVVDAVILNTLTFSKAGGHWGADQLYCRELATVGVNDKNKEGG